MTIYFYFCCSEDGSDYGTECHFFCIASNCRRIDKSTLSCPGHSKRNGEMLSCGTGALLGRCLPGQVAGSQISGVGFVSIYGVYHSVSGSYTTETMLRYFGYDLWNMPYMKSPPVELGHRMLHAIPDSRRRKFSITRCHHLIPTFLLSPCRLLAAQPYVSDVLSDRTSWKCNTHTHAHKYARMHGYHWITL